MRIYRVKRSWYMSVIAVSIFAATILTCFWIEQFASNQIDPIAYFYTLVISPIAFSGLAIYPRLYITVDDKEISFHGARERRMLFNDILAFKVYANYASIKSSTRVLRITRDYQDQWEIVDYVARKLVGLGRITHQEYLDMTKLFHGYSSQSGPR